jgi:hypothetical protein
VVNTVAEGDVAAGVAAEVEAVDDTVRRGGRDCA